MTSLIDDSSTDLAWLICSSAFQVFLVDTVVNSLEASRLFARISSLSSFSCSLLLPRFRSFFRPKRPALEMDPPALLAVRGIAGACRVFRDCAELEEAFNMIKHFYSIIINSENIYEWLIIIVIAMERMDGVYLLGFTPKYFPSVFDPPSYVWTMRISLRGSFYSIYLYEYNLWNESECFLCRRQKKTLHKVQITSSH